MMTDSSSSPPPWQVLELAADRLDPQSIATAACVCKSWWASMSSDHLWQPFCSTAYPSLASLHARAAVPYCKLFSLGRAADERRLRKPPEPQLSMLNLIFAIDIVQYIDGRSRVATVMKPGASIKADKSGVFRFDIDVGGDDEKVAFEAVDCLRVTWNLVLEGFKGVFTMMDCKGKGSFVVGLEGWFSKELPVSAGCCSNGGSGDVSGMVADLRLGMMEEEGRMVVEKISVGMLSVVSWRYVCVADALRYLQYFLLPCNN